MRAPYFKAHFQVPIISSQGPPQPPSQVIHNMIRVHVPEQSCMFCFYVCPLNQYQTYIKDNGLVWILSRNYIMFFCLFDKGATTNSYQNLINDAFQLFRRSLVFLSMNAKLPLIDWGRDSDVICSPLKKKALLHT